MRTLFIFWIGLYSISLITGQLSNGLSYDPDAIVDAETARQKWQLIEYRLKSIVDAATRMLLPRLTDGKNMLNVSSTCLYNGLKITSGLRRLKSWAIKFFDASSKSIDGLFDSTFASFGAYDECLNNMVIDERPGKSKGEILFQGKYCRVEIRVYLPPKPEILHFSDRLEAFKSFPKGTALGEMATHAHLLYYTPLVGGICVPSGCSEHDVNYLLRQAGDFVGVVMKATRCEIKEETKLTPVMIGVIALFSFTGFLVLISTLADIYFHHRKINVEGKTGRFLVSFSFITNFRKFTDTSSSSDNLSCLNGIRTLTICWIVLSHAYLFTSLRIQSFPSDIEEFIQDFAVQAILNGSFAVDTFFVIGGFLLCYNAAKAMKIGKKSFSLTMYVAHRLWRLLPCYVYVIAFNFLIPLLGSGPMYHESTDHFVQSCQRNWWAAVLFINNFYDTKYMCVGHGWYLAVDVQLYLSALIILLPLMRSAKTGISVGVSLILASMIGTAVHVHMSGLPAALLITPTIADQEKFMSILYLKPHFHAGPYIVGMLCGYMLAMKPKTKIPKIVQIMGWSLAAAFSLCVVNGIQKWNSGVIPSFWEKMLYSSCNRVAWAMAVAWVIVACSTGHGGIVSYLFSWKIWVPLARLSFLAYLVHPLVIGIFLGSARTIFHYDHSYIVWQFFGHLIPTYLVAFGGSMLVEAPFVSLEKAFLAERHAKTPESSDNQKIASEDLVSHVKDDKTGFANRRTLKSEEKCGITNTGFVCKL